MATQEDYAKLLKRVREETGIDSLVPDDTGLVSVRVEDGEIVVVVGVAWLLLLLLSPDELLLLELELELELDAADAYAVCA